MLGVVGMYVGQMVEGLSGIFEALSLVLITIKLGMLAMPVIPALRSQE